MLQSASLRPLWSFWLTDLDALLYVTCSSSVHNHYIPLPVCCDVWWHGPWPVDDVCCALPGSPRESSPRPEEWQRGIVHLARSPTKHLNLTWRARLKFTQWSRRIGRVHCEFQTPLSSFCLSADIQHGVCRSLHHPPDGSLLGLHWNHLQWLLLQIPQHVRLWMERPPHVWCQRSKLDVSQSSSLTPSLSENHRFLEIRLDAIRLDSILHMQKCNQLCKTTVWRFLLDSFWCTSFFVLCSFVLKTICAYIMHSMPVVMFILGLRRLMEMLFCS